MLKRFRLGYFLGLVLIVGLFFHTSLSRALTFPTTTCDQQQVDFQIYGVNAHLADTSQREDGTRAFV